MSGSAPGAPSERAKRAHKLNAAALTANAYAHFIQSEYVSNMLARSFGTPK
ncbi:MAG: hypothetical protein JWM63_3981, partial [Gammaproteobacteria bacterium]|nr:hypothetical protein [Gammaproteobacteria bacterium]